MISMLKKIHQLTNPYRNCSFWKIDKIRAGWDSAHKIDYLRVASYRDCGDEKVAVDS